MKKVITLTESQLKKVIDNLVFEQTKKSNILMESDEEMESPSDDSISTANDIEQLEKSSVATDDESKPMDNAKTEFTVSVKVSKYDMKMVEKAIQSLKKAVKKFGMEEPIIKIGEPYEKNIVVKYDDLYGNKTHRLELQDITIVMDKLLKYSGDYTLVAVVDNTTGGSILINNETCPTEYLKQTNGCDGCGLPRIRYKIFVVRDENGEYKRFGGDCVQKYLGIHPGKFINFLSFWKDYVGSFSNFGIENEMSFGGGGFKGFSPQTLLCDINQLITAAKQVLSVDNRYVKKEWETDDSGWGRREPVRSNFGQATADKIQQILYPDSIYGNMKELDVDMEFVNSVKNFYQNLDTSTMSGGFGEFLMEIKKLVTSDQARIKDIGPIGYGVHFYMKQKAKEGAEGEEKKPSEFVGTVGEKMEFPWLKIVDYKSGEGMYGLWKLWIMEDKMGNIIKKFGEIGIDFLIGGPVEGKDFIGIGDEVSFISDVKNHEVNKYSKQKETTIGRLSRIKPPKVKKLKETEEFLQESLNKFKLLTNYNFYK